MKKFEVVINGSNYDYVTKNMIHEYLQSAFTRADIEVKTVRRAKDENQSRRQAHRRTCNNER